MQTYDIEKWFTENISAKDTKRPQLQAMLEYAREGDTIYIWDFSRLARNTKDLLSLIEQFQAKGINLVSCRGEHGYVYTDREAPSDHGRGD